MRAPPAAPLPRTAGQAWSHLPAVALAVWTGIHALRSFWSMLVWNIAEDRAPPQIALIALGFWTVGMLAWLAARWVGGREPARRFGLLFALVYVAHQAVAHPVLTPALSVAAVILWLWFFPSLVLALGRHGAGDLLLPGILAGVAAQVALQAGLHGLDLPVLHGLRPALAAVLLSAGLFAALTSILSQTTGEDAGTLFPGWGLLAFGPYLMLQLTLLANAGRIGVLSGWDLRASAGVILIGLIAASAALLRPAPPRLRTAAGLLAVGLLLAPAWLRGGGIWLVPAVQVLLALPVAAALAPRGRGRPERVYAWVVAGAMLFFVLTFLYYRDYGWPALWPVMAGLCVIPGLDRRLPAFPGTAARPALALTVIVAAAGLGAESIGRGPQTASGPAPAALTVLTYNIHEAFDAGSVPDPEATARTIEVTAADVIALQEVGRGWNITGGPDLLPWLRWRLPQYRVAFAAILGDQVGLVILSRYEIAATGRVLYPRRGSSLSYGLQWATIPTAAGPLLVVNTHFTPYDQWAPDRTAQAGDLLDFWQGRRPAIILGDFNAQPDEDAIRRLQAAGLVDVAAVHGLGDANTYPCDSPRRRIDYIFSTPEIVSLAAAVPRSRASDHCPVEARVRLR